MIPFGIFQTISRAIAYQVGVLQEAEIDTRYDNIGTYPLSFYLHDTLPAVRTSRADTDAEATLSAPLDSLDYTVSLDYFIANKYREAIEALKADIETQYDNINTYLQAAAYDVHRNFAYAWYCVTREYIHANNVYCGLNNWPVGGGPAMRPAAQSATGGYAEGYNDVERVNSFMVGATTVAMGHLVTAGAFTDGCRIGTGASSTMRYYTFDPGGIGAITGNPEANYGNAHLLVKRTVAGGAWTIDVDYVQEDGTAGTEVGIAVPVGLGATVAMANAAVDITDIRETTAPADGSECRIEIDTTVPPVSTAIDQ